MRVVPHVTNCPPSCVVMQQDVPVGTDTRLLISVGNAWYPLAFLGLRKDGSIVCGPGRRAPILERSARRRAHDGSPLPTKLRADNGTTRTPNNFHITFHTSGIINSPGSARTYRARLDSEGPHQLCRFSFEHPSRARAVVAVRKRDVALPGEFQLSTALRGQLTIIPDGVVAIFGDVAEQAVFILNVQRRDGSTAYRLQFSVFGTDAPWPNETTIEWVSQDPERHGFAG